MLHRRMFDRLRARLSRKVSRWLSLAGALMALSFAALAAHAQVQPLVADLSKHLVAITTAFSGTDVLLFGATDGPGDVVMVVRGPTSTEVVRRKEQVGIIWANKESVVFEDAPTFYRVASNRPMATFTTPQVLARHQIGLDQLNLNIRDEDFYLPKERQAFREAFLRLKREKALYGEDGEGQISLLANRLFRVNLTFPANVPVGTYQVEVYLFRDGEVISAEITPLIISKIGVGAELFDFARQRGLLYGLASVAVAVFTGWLAAFAFRKG